MTCCPVHRRRRPFGGGDPGDQDEDFGTPGGNDGDSGSTGGGGGDWGSDGEEEGGHFGDIASALWLWRALCVCSVLQVQPNRCMACLLACHVLRSLCEQMLHRAIDVECALSLVKSRFLACAIVEILI